jgi:LysM repeat protein
MLRKDLAKGGVLVILIVALLSIHPAAARPMPAPHFSTPDELIQAVNALRAERGLAPYRADPILMSIAQAQADYIISISAPTHTGPDGSRPFERALAAGYLVAGDLSKGGFFSENLTGGVGQTAADAVEAWTGDAPHLNTMASSILQDAGAGVAVNGNTFYYVLDAGLSTGGSPVAYTPPPGRALPNTPNPDGSIVHIVQTGDTLGSISLAYGVPLADLLRLNNFNDKTVIYVNQKIKVSGPYTPTPTQPTGTPTIKPTITEWPTSSPTKPATAIPPTPTPAAVLPRSEATGALYVIVIAAVVMAAGITFLGMRKKKL